jgi:hypothetical protein
MLTYEELVELERSLRDRTVLSVYINGEVRDPADRRRWRVDLRHALDAIEARLADASHAERVAFAKCRKTVEEEARTFRGTVREPGWVRFIDTEGVKHSSGLPVAVPTMAVWDAGAHVAPYTRAMKASVPVIVGVLDARKARLFRYVGRKVDPVETVRAHVVVEPPLHMGRPSRGGFHSGTRGETGTDAAQRELREGTEHMLADVAAKIEALSGRDTWIVLGGIPEVAKAALAHLSPQVAPRAVCREGLDVHATLAQIADAANDSARALREAADLERVEEAVASAASDHRGVTGLQATKRALEEKRVRAVFLTEALLSEHDDDAESVARGAFDSHAQIEVVSGAAAARLEPSDGIAALLYYPIDTTGRELTGSGADSR